MVAVDASITEQIADLTHRSRELRADSVLTGSEVDRAGVDATENMRHIAGGGLNRLNVPPASGGRRTCTPNFVRDAVTEIIAKISAGDGQLPRRAESLTSVDLGQSR